MVQGSQKNRSWIIKLPTNSMTCGFDTDCNLLQYVPSSMIDEVISATRRLFLTREHLRRTLALLFI